MEAPVSRFALALACVLFAASPALSADLYVAKSRGDNGNPGTTEAPFKNIDAALAKSAPGDTVHVAEGVYFGLRGRGYIEAPHPVTLLGGYADDFSGRDPLAHPTLLQPDQESAGKSGNPILTLKSSQPGRTFRIDGFVFDGGFRNAYSAEEGWPKDVETGMLLLPPVMEKNPHPSVIKQCLFIENAAGPGDVLIQHNTFVNCTLFAIQAAHKQGTFKVIDNVFVANRMAAIEVFGIGGKKGPKGPIEKDGEVEIAYNTILFSWSRTKDLKDMGYGVRIMTMLGYNIHHNIIGASVLTGVDHTRFNPNAWVRVEHNVFFVNKQSPMLFSEPGNVKMERVQAGDLGDLGLAGASGNREEALKLPIDKAYLEGFLAASYTEQQDYDPNSPANLWREAMGLNKQGKLITSASMFANRYPWRKALELFGAHPTAGARKPAN
jgi:hypothetical protein